MAKPKASKRSRSLGKQRLPFHRSQASRESSRCKAWFLALQANQPPSSLKQRWQPSRRQRCPCSKQRPDSSQSSRLLERLAVRARPRSGQPAHLALAKSLLPSVPRTRRQSLLFKASSKRARTSSLSRQVPQASSPDRKPLCKRRHRLLTRMASSSSWQRSSRRRYRRLKRSFAC